MLKESAFSSGQRKQTVRPRQTQRVLLACKHVGNVCWWLHSQPATSLSSALVYCKGGLLGLSTSTTGTLTLLLLGLHSMWVSPSKCREGKTHCPLCLLTAGSPVGATFVLSRRDVWSLGPRNETHWFVHSSGYPFESSIGDSYFPWIPSQKTKTTSHLPTCQHA